MTCSMSSFVFLVAAVLVVASSSSFYCLAYQCGAQGGGASCAVGLCCSRWGWCGTSDAYCAPGNCQSQCPTPSPVPPPPPPTSPPPPPPPPPPPASPPPPVYDITDTIDRAMFNEMFPNMNLITCMGPSYYNYDNFVTAARSFPGFGTTGNVIMRKREVAAFLGQTGYETTDGSRVTEIFELGYCHVIPAAGSGKYGSFCIEDPKWPCPRSYFGRGPIMLKYNYNYGQAGEALGLGLKLLYEPILVAADPIVGFKTAIWFWMTEQLPKPSCHDVMVGNWTPSVADLRAQRLPGYGLTTNIITSNHNSTQFECGNGQDKRVQDRITFYERACNILGVDPGLNLDCFQQEPFDLISKLWNTE